MDQPVGEEVEGNQTSGCFLIRGRSQTSNVSWALSQHESAIVNVQSHRSLKEININECLLCIWLKLFPGKFTGS